MSTAEAPAGILEPVCERKTPIRIVIADDHPIVRESLKKLFEVETDLQVAGEASNGREVVDRLNETDADVLLLELLMPQLDGLTTLEAVRKSNTRLRVIILTASEDPADFARARATGCDAVLQKQIGLNKIVECVRTLSAGNTWPGGLETTADPNELTKAARRPSRLSARECEIAALIARAYRNKAIADKLFITEQTVKNHLRNIYQKLGVPSRLEVALYALQEGLDVSEQSDAPGTNLPTARIKFRL
jgi:two-component system NarL family response regulator